LNNRSPTSKARSKAALAQDDSAVDISEEIKRLEQKGQTLARGDLLQTFRVAGLPGGASSAATLHARLPALIFTDFEELHGDRAFADDHAIVGGLARLNGEPVMVIGHQKGRDTKEKIFRNFGMPRPEGYRKALRLMRLAEKFGIPVLTFIDTPGAPIRASTPKSVASPRQSAAIST
jgi:acetyl-CoA carboxylase carboxyl transferase subunit alpha